MSKTRNNITWALTILTAVLFMLVGFSKVTGQQALVEAFAAFGLPDWFRILIGSLEIMGGLLLLIPAFTGMSSFGLSAIMLGAMFCHVMFESIAASVPAFIIFCVLTYLYLTRKNVIPTILQKHLIVRNISI